MCQCTRGAGRCDAFAFFAAPAAFVVREQRARRARLKLIARAVILLAFARRVAEVDARATVRAPRTIWIEERARTTVVVVL